MSKFSPSSQNFDGGLASFRRKRKAGNSVSGPTPRVMVPVKRVGRHKAHHYCPSCGQKLKVCRCGE